VGCQSSLKHAWLITSAWIDLLPQTGESCLGGNHIVSISNTSGISTQPLFGNVWEYFCSQDQILTLSDLPSSTFHAFCVLRLEGTWTYLRFACEGSTCLFCFSTRSFRIKFGHHVNIASTVFAFCCGLPRFKHFRVQSSLLTSLKRMHFMIFFCSRPSLGLGLAFKTYPHSCLSQPGCVLYLPCCS